jgi:hypothetical protein
LQGFGLQSFDAKNNELAKPAEVACMADGYGDRAKGQTAMENCLQRARMSTWFTRSMSLRRPVRTTH